MQSIDQMYVGGKWCKPSEPYFIDIVNPASEEVIGQVAMASVADVNVAVSAAKLAFESWSQTTREDRLALLDKIIEKFAERLPEMAEAISLEMGAPTNLALNSQAPMGLVHLQTTRAALHDYVFEESLGSTHIIKEPVGVCAFITPWNWPINQIVCKVAPALACGCTMILKPSEFAPLSAKLFAEILDEAGVPAGIFNLLNGEGPVVGEALAQHPDVDMISLTGSTRAGVLVSKSAADTVKRVALELGGKSANIILEDADLEKAVSEGVVECFNNTGQSCNAPTRMLVPAHLHKRAVEIAVSAAEATVVGLPNADSTRVGPLSNEPQFAKVQSMIEQAIADQSELVVGGVGRPTGLTSGYFVKPTIFANVTSDMIIAQQEVFGPVLAIMPYDNESQAIDLANDTPYGLAAYVQSSDIDHARSVARKIRAGTVFINGNNFDPNAPFGGFKQSGNGREWGVFAFHDFLEVKGVVGYNT